MKRFTLLLLVACPLQLAAQNLTIQNSTIDTSRTLHQHNPLLLKEIQLKGKSDFKKDSARIRYDFSKVFSYKAPGIMDIFIKKSTSAPRYTTPYQAPNSTASIISVDVLSVIGLFSKKKSSMTSLQKILLAEEETKMIDRQFSPLRISALTKLKGDSLNAFIIQYRPTLKEVRKMDNYQLIQYIKKSHEKFLKSH